MLSDDEDVERGASPFQKLLAKINGFLKPYDNRFLDYIIDPDKIQASLADVVVEDYVKVIMKQILSLSTFHSKCISQKLFQQMRISGALLYGPPGTGKTHLARAIAKDMGMNMMAITPAAIYGKYVGESENNIKTAFSICSKLTPCILFIDEADALFSRRSSSGERWERACINQFLQEMDGIATRKDAPFVLAATNRPSYLDEAFLRRLPQRIQFKLPSKQARRQILINLLEGTQLDSDVILELVDSTEGYSGSDLKTLCVQAALIFSYEEAQNETEHSNEDIPQSHGLERRHFIEALKRTFRTVSEHNEIDSEEFENTFRIREITDTKEDTSYALIYEDRKKLPLEESYICNPCGRIFPSKAEMENHVTLSDEEACRTGITMGEQVNRLRARRPSHLIYPHDYTEGPNRSAALQVNVGQDAPQGYAVCQTGITISQSAVTSSTQVVQVYKEACHSKSVHDRLRNMSHK